MSTTIIIIILLVLLFGGGGGFYGYRRYGAPGLFGILVFILIVLAILWFLGVLDGGPPPQ